MGKSLIWNSRYGLVSTPVEGSFHVTRENFDKLVHLAHAAEFTTPRLAEITVLEQESQTAEGDLQPQAQAELARDSYFFLTGQLDARGRECYDHHIWQLRRIVITARDRQAFTLTDFATLLQDMTRRSEG